MPQTYAHQYFGDLVYEQLPQEIRGVISEHKDLYDIGLQGPDILFYYHPLWKNAVAALGSEMHGWSGRRFFRRAVTALTGIDPLAGKGSDAQTTQETPTVDSRLYTSLASENAGSDDADAALVYLYGCLCHFALDSLCHPYINEYDRMESGVTHSVIEGDFDRHLIAQAGRDPVLEDHVARFQPSAAAARVIGRFYPEVPQKILYKALRSFVMFHHLLRCSSDHKRHLLLGGIRLIGQYNSLRGHITTANADPLCKESSTHLTELLKSAVPCAAGLISGFSQNLCYDTQFALNFNGERPVEDASRGGGSSCSTLDERRQP